MKVVIAIDSLKGSLTSLEAEVCNKHGIDAMFPILREVKTLQEVMDSQNARKNMIATVEQVFRLIENIRRNK